MRKDYTPAILFLCLALLSAGILFSGLNASLRDWDEAVYAQVARENLLHYDWYNLYWNDQPWIDKPPLILWLTRIMYELFDVGEWQARAVSAFTGFILVMIIAWWGWRSVSPDTGILAGLILLGTPHFVSIAKMGQLDVPVALFITAALYFFYFSPGKNRYFVISGICTGLAILTKWTVGLFSPLVQACLFLFPEYRRALKNKWWWIGGGVTALVCCSWIIQQYCTYGTTFLEHFFGVKMVTSVTTAIAGHEGGLLFYAAQMLHKARPWCYLFLPAVLFLGYRAKTGDSLSRFLVVWCGIIFVLFSAATTKLHWYIMPLYPPLALATAYCSMMIVKKVRFRKLILVAAFVIIIGHIFFTRQYIKLDLNPEIKQLVAAIYPDIDTESRIFVFRDTFFPSLRFYTDTQVLTLNDEADFSEYFALQNRLLIVTRQQNEPLLKEYHAKQLFSFVRPPVSTGDYIIWYVKPFKE